MSKRLIRIVGGVAAVLVVGLLYALIVRGVMAEREQHSVLEEQIAPLETALAAQHEGQQVLVTRRAELATAEAELREARLSFPGEVDNIEVVDYVVATAADHGVKLGPVEARDAVTATVDTGTYRVFAYDVEIEGTVAAISSFLTALESGSIATLKLDQIRLDVQPTPTAGYQASLVVQIYVHP